MSRLSPVGKARHPKKTFLTLTCVRPNIFGCSGRTICRTPAAAESVYVKSFFGYSEVRLCFFFQIALRGAKKLTKIWSKFSQKCIDRKIGCSSGLRKTAAALHDYWHCLGDQAETGVHVYSEVSCPSTCPKFTKINKRIVYDTFIDESLLQFFWA